MSDRALRKFEKTPNKGFIAREIVLLSEALDDMRHGKPPHGNIKTLSGTIRQRGAKQGLALAEWKMTIRSRLVFDAGSSELKVIDFATDDTHTVVEELDVLSNHAFAEILATLAPVPDWVSNIIAHYATAVPSFEIESFQDDPDDSRDREQFIEQRFNDWIRFLDTHQEEVRDRLILNLSSADSPDVHILLGGPGTGKTMILLDLANSHALYSDEEPSLILPSGVKHYVESLDPLIPGLHNGLDGGVILLDDPETFEKMRDCVDAAQSLNKHIVIAIDPTQWHKRRTIEKFHGFLEKTRHVRYELTNAYRQGEGVGGPAMSLTKSFLRKSSAFAADYRFDGERSQAQEWEKLCLDEIKFADVDGTWEIYTDADGDILAHVRQELEAIQTFQTERNWPKTLIGWQFKKHLPSGVKALLEEAKASYPKFTYRVRSYGQVEEIRGTEFESVLLFITHRQMELLLRGIRGAGTDDWELVTPLLTFFSRAENRLAIFVVSELVEQEHI
jgi:hypothetical protein